MGSSRESKPTWEELAALRWGPGLDDSTPGRVIDRPDPQHRLDGNDWWEAARDPYARAEREAIQKEDE